jgi:hypothetical protein
VSIDRRLLISDNHGACPCLPPQVLGRLLDRIERGRPMTLAAKIRHTLANLQRRLAK